MNNNKRNYIFINKKKQLIKNKSLPDIKSKYDLNKLDNFNELPTILSKNRINKSNMAQKGKKKLSIKKLIFNPISYVYLNNLKLLSQVTPISKNVQKYYSIREINDFTKRKFFPSSQTIDNNHSRNTKRVKNLIRNMSDIDKRPSLSIIDLSNKYTSKINLEEDNKFTKLENKQKVGFYSNRHILNFKKSITDLYNRVDNRDKIYQSKARFVHDFLFQKNKNNYFNINNSINHTPQYQLKSEEKTSYEVNPKYEYIDYFGISNKIITKLTSSTKYNNTEKINNINNFHNQFLKFKIQLKNPYLASYENIDDYRNKNYIKIIEKKKKEKNSKEKNNNIKKMKELNRLIEISKRGYNKMVNSKNRYFEKMVDDAIKSKNKINDQLVEFIDLGKKSFEQEL